MCCEAATACRRQISLLKCEAETAPKPKQPLHHGAERSSIARPRVGDHSCCPLGDYIVMVLVPEFLHRQCHFAPLFLCGPQLDVLLQHVDALGVLVRSAVDVEV